MPASSIIMTIGTSNEVQVDPTYAAAVLRIPIVSLILLKRQQTARRIIAPIAHSIYANTFSVVMVVVLTLEDSPCVVVLEFLHFNIYETKRLGDIINY